MEKPWAGLDLLAVLVFVLIGRSVHSHGLSLGGIASTVWPFLCGLAVGWCAVDLLRRDGLSLKGGLYVVVSTVVVGMSLRVIAGQGTTVAFVGVALGFLGAIMLGWRLLKRLLRSGP